MASIYQLTMDDISTLDRQIEQLYDYKPIPENEVKGMCDKVSLKLENSDAQNDYVIIKRDRLYSHEQFQSQPLFSVGQRNLDA